MELYRIMALDFGLVRIGVAITDPMRIIAKPFKTIQNTSSDEVIMEIKKIIKKENVAEAVLGLPLNLDGEDTKQTGYTKEFMAVLSDELDIPIVWQDERFTSVDANESIKKMGMNPIEGRKIIDQIAASLILRDYLSRIGK